VLFKVDEFWLVGEITGMTVTSGPSGHSHGTCDFYVIGIGTDEPFAKAREHYEKMLRREIEHKEGS
jgi:hypothetical protein